MPIITLIKPQKSKRRVNIFLDGKFGFGIDLENYVKLGLKVGRNLSDEEIIEISQKAEFQKVWDRLLVFASIRPRSEKEITDWMFRKRVSEKFKKTLLEKLAKLEFLNDEKFAEWWVEQRLAFKAKSKRELLQELRNKGIKNEIIVKVFEKLLKVKDELNSAKKLIGKNSYKWRNLSEKLANQKMQTFLARKGFGWDVIKSVTSSSEKK